MKRNHHAPRLTHDDLLQLAREHRQRGKAVAGLLTRRKNVNAEGEAEVAALLADPSPAAKAYKLLGSSKHRADATTFATERLRLLEPVLGRSLWEGRHHHGRLQQALAEFEAAERTAPSLEDVILNMTGEAGWSLSDMLTGALLEQVTTRNVRDELRTAPPSRRLEMYEEAAASPDDPVSAIVLATMERERIPYPADVPAGPDESTSAARLGRLMMEAQARRLPDLTEVRMVLDEVGRVLSHAELAGVAAVNPSQTVGEPEPLPAPIAVGEDL